MGNTRPGAPSFPHTPGQGAKTPSSAEEDEEYQAAQVKKRLGLLKEKTWLPWLQKDQPTKDGGGEE